MSNLPSDRFDNFLSHFRDGGVKTRIKIALIKSDIENENELLSLNIHNVDDMTNFFSKYYNLKLLDAFVLAGWISSFKSKLI